jgi:hypothetical protein
LLAVKIIFLATLEAVMKGDYALIKWKCFRTIGGGDVLKFVRIKSHKYNIIFSKKRFM